MHAIGQPQSLGAMPFDDGDDVETVRITGVDCFGNLIWSLLWWMCW